MNIHLKQAVWVQDIEIPAGKYHVGVDVDHELVILSQADTSFKLEAMRRNRKARFKSSSVEIRAVVGEPRWLLLVRIPPISEWVVTLNKDLTSNNRIVTDK